MISSFQTSMEDCRAFDDQIIRIRQYFLNTADNLKPKKNERGKEGKKRKEKSSTQPIDTFSSTRFPAELISGLFGGFAYNNNVNVTSDLMFITL